MTRPSRRAAERRCVRHHMLAGCRLAALAAALQLNAGCSGWIGEGDPDGKSNGTPPPRISDEVAALVPVTASRRLTQWEYGNTVASLLGEKSDAYQRTLPTDDSHPDSPFDNDYTVQVASQALINGAERLAIDTAQSLIEDAARRDTLVGCKPASPTDSDCFRSFVRRFGRRALRRPLDDADMAAFMRLQAVGIAAGDFYAGVRAALSAFLQDARLLYRIELGSAVPGQTGIYRLNDFEVASRLSYLIWGSTPDDALLDRAAAGQLDTPEQLQQTALQMLDDPRAKAMVTRYHDFWLDSHEIAIEDPTLRDAMRLETAALIERVVVDDKRPWQDVFLSDETFVTDQLTSHYGLSSSGSAEPRWVSYRDTGRRGIIAHGSFLAPSETVEDTSPTIRGLKVRARLLCQTIEAPPNIESAMVAPQAGGECKPQTLAAHAAGPCASCHTLMDPIGFGLERYDAEGKYRTEEPGKPNCKIDGKGEISGIGQFGTIAELAVILTQADAFRRCMLQQLYRYAIGRVELDRTDHALIDKVHNAIPTTFRFDEAVVQLVSHPTFVHRRDRAR